MNESQQQRKPRHYVGLGGGLYIKPEDGTYWARPMVHGRRAGYRKLKAVKEKEAFKEVANRNWEGSVGDFDDLAVLYSDAGCPNKRLEPRDDTFCKPEKLRVELLRKFFGPMDTADITLAKIPLYKVWRMRRGFRRGSGERTIDTEMNTLSNIMSYGAATGLVTANLVRSGRPKYRKAKDVRHARDVAPQNADVIHQIVDSIFDEGRRSETLGWQALFAMFTGCRTSELLRLRIDADGPEKPGFIQNDYLYLGRRSKGGVNPWAMIGPEFRQMLECFHRWHDKAFPKSPWMFPGRLKHAQPVGEGSLGHAMAKACAALKLPHITPHGLRSYYVTKRRSDGIADTVIAGEIGDKTVSLMETTYGARPANWTGGVALGWLPKDRLAAWLRWQDEAKKTVVLKRAGK